MRIPRARLRAVMGTGLLIAAVLSAATPCPFTIARLHYGGGGDWYANPSSLPNLVAAIKQRTTIALCDTVATVTIMGENLFRHPFIYLTGHGDVRFTSSEKLRLRAYLLGGGFLWADDNYGLDASLRREIRSLFPENPLVELPAGHPIFTSVYRLPGLPKIHEHDGKPAQAFGVVVDGRVVLLYTYSSDIGDGMEDIAVHNDGPQAHEAGLRMGVNIVVWFLKQ